MIGSPPKRPRLAQHVFENLRVLVAGVGRCEPSQAGPGDDSFSGIVCDVVMSVYPGDELFGEKIGKLRIRRQLLIARLLRRIGYQGQRPLGGPSKRR